jgi:hypothetical protein
VTDVYVVCEHGRFGPCADCPPGEPKAECLQVGDYTVPLADADLLGCGVVLTAEHLVNVWAMNSATRRHNQKRLLQRRWAENRRAHIERQYRKLLNRAEKRKKR